MKKTMCNFRHRIAGLLLLLLVLTASGTTSFAGRPPATTPPPVTYTLTFLDPTLTLRKTNEAGAAVGWTSGSTPLAKVRLADGTLIDLTTVAQNSDPNYPWTLLDYAVEINEAGSIAGRGRRIEEDGKEHARLFRYTLEEMNPETGVILRPARLEAIRTGDAESTLFIKGMNDYGDVVLHASTSGQSSLPATPRAGDSAWIFSGDPGIGNASPLILGGPAVPGAINNFGEVTGAMDTGTGSFAFISTSLGTYTFGTINGNTTSRYDVSEGKAMNDSGIIAGWARAGKGKTKEDTSMRAVRLGSNDIWVDLAGTSSGANSWAVAMNNAGVTVGTAGGVNGLGFVTLSGKIYALSDLMVPLPANLKYVNPTDISDAGVICGSVTIQNTDGTTSESAMILIPSSVPAP